jgi:DNA-binding response OmpR family regulator
MATVKRTSGAATAPQGEAARASGIEAPPHVLRCLVVSLSADRRRLIRAAAEAQAWDAIVCRDAGEFLGVAFKRSVPLLLVDLPHEGAAGYHELREATDRAKQVSQALLVVAGSGSDGHEEIWARSMGAWGYFSEAFSRRSFELVLSDARLALERTCAWFRLPLHAQTQNDSS